ncbi:MAG: hypothetical protein IID34_08255, partial [Planctomycetes bacterium]|nr:hypothetical protein [Planctomycetota bacterium]
MQSGPKSYESSFAAFARFCTLLSGVLAGCMTAPTAAQPASRVGATDLQTMLLDPAAVNPDIPTPASIIGHEIGDGAVRYAPAVRYLRALADASPLVTLTPYAETHEGRALYFLTITSAAN